MKKSQLIGLSTLAVTLGVVGVTSFASAANGTTSTSIVDKIATKFGLKKSDVQAVFDADHSEKEAERLANVSDRLQNLVDKGTITADQKTKIEAKLKEMQTTRDTERTALEKWASDNGIDVKYVMMGRGPREEAADNRLQNLVGKGTITADQKTKIEAKVDELQKQREEDRLALQKWASDNGVDIKYLMGGGMGMRGMGGPKGAMM